MSDKEFDINMEKMRAGDKSALRNIYVEYNPYIYHLILGMVGHREDAEDITSEFFIRLFNNASKYKSGSGHKAYLCTVARNLAIDYMRKHQREILSSFDESPQNDGDINVYNMGENISGDNTEEEVLSNIGINEALNYLKPAEREVIHYKIALELTFDEIAKITGSPLGTVAWRYREAIRKLRRCGYGA